LIEATRQLRLQSEVVIISLHSGPNYLDQVPAWQRELAHTLVEAGATIILMHSAHHVLPMERYQGGLIFYALGDLLNDYSVNQRYRNDLGATALITLHPKAEPEVTLRPHILKRRARYPLSPESPDGRLTLSRLKALSSLKAR
jgi:poly-gamma-glutamate synthesis protein (capsule biosynthesis protein)